MEKVYILERGMYENQSIVGVFSTPQKAMEGLPGNFTKYPDEDRWSNGLDWDDACTVTAFKIDEI